MLPGVSMILFFKYVKCYLVLTVGYLFFFFQILIDGNATDIKGSPLTTLVYLAREKRPQHPHNFKAGAMNAW